VRTLLANALLVASRLPRVGHTRATDGQRAEYEAAWSARSAARPLLPYLRWLALTQDVVFHGSATGDVAELSTVRKSRDAKAYGDREAVYASQDPVWSLFYAVLDRGAHLGSMRSASLGADQSPIGRRYFFSVDRGVGDHRLFGDGWLYVLPAAGFEHERRALGLFDTAHRTSRRPVSPLACFAVTTADFPLRRTVGRHDDSDSVARTIWRSRVRGQGAAPGFGAAG
jgi:hypothetical protein